MGLTQCEWPARLEWLRLAAGGELLIDAAHNPAGAAALASYLQDTGSKPLPVIFAAMADKDLTNMIGALKPIASAFVATTVPHARARTADDLADDIRRMVQVPVSGVEDPEAAVARALELAPRAVACGSIYMIGPLRARLIEAGAGRL
jgi:dihydrofolate synthase/folylpolyglutamate synthase